VSAGTRDGVGDGMRVRSCKSPFIGDRLKEEPTLVAHSEAKFILQQRERDGHIATTQNCFQFFGLISLVLPSLVKFQEFGA
jgi:hypothetical protein